MKINTNIASLNAQAQNTMTNNELSNSLEKLSSGLKINKAADDASGMAIADKLRMQASTVGQGIANANSGSALITIADKAMGEQSKILDTVKTKLLQASTSTTSAEGREAIRKDVQKLLQQINDISTQTTYNGVNLLNEKGTDFTFQVGEKSTDTISMQTAYSINTEGLGSAGRDFANSTTLVATAAGQVLGNITLEGEATDAKLSVKSTAGQIDVAFTSRGGAIEVSGVGVTAFSGGAAGMMITTENAEDIAFLNAQANAVTTDGLTKLADGVYSLTAASQAFTNGSIFDFEGLKVSMGTATGTFTMVNATEATISKLSGSADMTVSNATEAVIDGDTAEGIGFGAAINVSGGVVAVQATSPSTDGAIAINTINAATASEVAELSISIASESLVQSISLWNTAGASSVFLSTTDGETANALEAAGLTRSLDGTYAWSSTSSGTTTTLSFAGSGIQIANLTVEGLSKTTTGSERIYVETAGAVTVENLRNVSGNVSDLQNGVGVQVSTWPAGGVTASAVSTDFTAAAVDSGLGASQLSGLMSLGEGKLTAETAKNFMSVIDDAMTQLNTVRSDFGSTQNQIRVAVDNMMTTQVNLKAAESTIRDVDYAAESANFNKQNIIAQAGTYAMSQANQVQQNVLRLLQ